MKTTKEKIVWYLWEWDDKEPFRRLPVAWKDKIYNAGLDEKLLRVVCMVYGHYVIDDQCGIPGHRYCMVCHGAQPNKEVSIKRL